MPELPEIETIKNDLEKKIIGKEIANVTVNLPGMVRGGLKELRSVLYGNNFKDLKRAGKLLIFILAKSKKYLLIHLKMTGQLIYRQGKTVVVGGHSLPNIQNGLPNKHTRIILKFKDGSQLFFNDLRTFGYMQLVNEQELNEVLKKYGAAPLTREFSSAYLQKILKNRTAPIKAILLNQSIIAGIGNIYADEILFQARVKPSRRASTLKKSEIKAIAKATKAVLKKAIKYRGTTFNNYVDANGNKGGFIKYLKVYQREGEKCLRCKQGTIVKAKIAGRGTRYCNRCQK